MSSNDDKMHPTAMVPMRAARPNSATPRVPEKKYRIINGQVTSVHSAQYCRRTAPSNRRPDNSDEESENNFESENLSKPDHITKECLGFIDIVNRSLENLLVFKEELDQEFMRDEEVKGRLNNLFRHIQTLHSAYKEILSTIDKLKAREGGFCLHEVLLDNVVKDVLKVYRPFLSQYATNAKWVGDLGRESKGCMVACERARRKRGMEHTVSIDGCLYTVFNSLFSLELMLDRYRKCYVEGSVQRRNADGAKGVISSLLIAVDTSQDQMEFVQTQKELNLLTGKSRESKINTRFILKGVAIKFARRDGKALSRQLVLFTDCLYVTTLPGAILVTSSVRQELSLTNMKLEVISENDITAMANQRWGLCIRAREAVQDFFFENEETMYNWMEKLGNAISDECESQPSEVVDSTDSLLQLGKEAPRWQKDSAASFCNRSSCNQKFSTAVRRHHCRADGLLYCDQCCSYKVKLEFERSAAESRVCELCYNILFLYSRNKKQLDSSRSQLREVFNKKTRSGTRIGWLQVRQYNKYKGIFLPETRYFCELDLADPMVHLYERHEDKLASQSIILYGMQVMTTGSTHAKGLSPKQFVIEHTDATSEYLMKASSCEDSEGWVQCLRDRITTSSNN